MGTKCIAEYRGQRRDESNLLESVYDMTRRSSIIFVSTQLRLVEAAMNEIHDGVDDFLCDLAGIIGRIVNLKRQE